MSQPDHEAISRTNVENFPENKIGRRIYTHRIDTNKLPVDRSFETEWIDGPVRFRFKHHDTMDCWLLVAEPSGSITSMQDGFEEDSMTGSRSGGGQSGRTTVSPAHDGFQESFGKGDVIYVKTSVDLYTNPLEFRLNRDKQSSDLSFWAGVDMAFDTPENEEYEITSEMLKAQIAGLLSHIRGKVYYKMQYEGPLGVVNMARAGLKEKYDNRVGDHLQDTVFILGLSERTAHAKRLHANGYTNVPDDEGANIKLSGVAEWVGEKAWGLGLIDKPEYVEFQEKLDSREEQRRQQPPQQQPYRGPPGKPDEKNNKCPGCGGQYHKDDLSTESLEGKHMTGTKWLCPDCGDTVGQESDYHGPVPVKMHTGTELH